MEIPMPESSACSFSGLIGLDLPGPLSASQVTAKNEPEHGVAIYGKNGQLSHNEDLTYHNDILQTPTLQTHHYIMLPRMVTGACTVAANETSCVLCDTTTNDFEIVLDAHDCVPGTMITLMNCMGEHKVRFACGAKGVKDAKGQLVDYILLLQGHSGQWIWVGSFWQGVHHGFLLDVRRAVIVCGFR